MDYGFDRIIERKNTGSVKYDSKPPDKAPDALPMWVADMDFESPKCVIEALERRVECGVFGYSLPTADYFAALEYWFGTRYGYKFEKDWVVMTPGIIFAVSMAIRTYTKPGDAIIIQEPLYPPIKQSILRNDRKAVINHLKLEDGVYRTDFIEFENQ
ncbi:MAG: aminotransferase class I/II-fold pyridoxal phosphate-dependent enzyme, partial [Defluviitaleaceae bacterium]|nr:aminotransferase class I/II-fold pyridoxal phosphate-dependent enzyme [Defluviitaleaceae bacterium]